jgi:hypothetical protein
MDRYNPSGRYSLIVVFATAPSKFSFSPPCPLIANQIKFTFSFQILFLTFFFSDWKTLIIIRGNRTLASSSSVERRVSHGAHPRVSSEDASFLLLFLSVCTNLFRNRTPWPYAAVRKIAAFHSAAPSPPSPASSSSRRERAMAPPP